MKGSLLKTNQSFICRFCKVDKWITDGFNTDLRLDIGNPVSLEKVDKFCYLEDMLDADGGCDSAVTTRVSIVYASYLGEKCNYSIISYAQMHITISLLTVVINMLQGLCRFDYQ